MRYFVAAFLALACYASAEGQTPPYFNSTEAICNPSDPTIILCDDFNTAWYTQPGVIATSGNPNPSPTTNKGWCGNCGAGTFTTPTAVLGKGVFNGWAARVPGAGSSVGGTNLADHAYKNFQGFVEVYVRYYYYTDSGYQWSGSKQITFNDGNPGDGGIKYGNFAFNPCGVGSKTTTASITFGISTPQDQCFGANVSGITIQSGRLYFFEHRHKLSTPNAGCHADGSGNWILNDPNCPADGIFQTWAEDCGTNLAAPTSNCTTGAPTLRMSVTNIKMRRTTASDLHRVLYLDFWANCCGSAGGNVGISYISNLIVRTSPIGFINAPASPPPGTPTNVKICRGTNCTP